MFRQTLLVGGFLLALSLVGLTHTLDYPLWERLLAPWEPASAT